VELFDVDRYNLNMTVAENLLFGTSADAAFDMDNLATNQSVMSILREEGIDKDFLHIGYRAAEIMVDIFADVSPESDLFEQFAFFSADDLPIYQALINQSSDSELDQLTTESQQMLSALPFRFIPARHRLGLIDENMQQKIISARHKLMRKLETDQAPVVFFDAGSYNPAISIQDNILFGKVAYGQALGQAKVGELIAETVNRLDLRPAIIRAGFEFEVGIAGARLSMAQRQKLAFARCLLKKPDVLIANEATAGLDPAAVTQLFHRLKQAMAGRGLVWVSSRVDLMSEFDRILVLDNGKVVEQGTYEELKNRDGVFQRLLAADAI
jgi:ABC-type antimicrobial peptide transport system ATPase subunit